MYALDGYGIPWFYHMYPVPWMFPPMYNKVRSKSPKKFRPKKQRSIVGSPAEAEKAIPEAIDSIQRDTVAGVTSMTTSALGSSKKSDTVLHSQTPVDASDDLPATATMPCLKPSNGPFSSQLDMIAHQAALQPKTNSVQPPQGDLTTIRNVPIHDDYAQSCVDGYNTMPSGRRNQRHIGNGLYGGRGNVGVPLYATAPFPMPVPPMGKPIKQLGGSHDVGYMVGSQGCGTVEIQKAAEYGGGQACNSCEPDH
jgi:hypothetical protein